MIKTSLGTLFQQAINEHLVGWVTAVLCRPPTFFLANSWLPSPEFSILSSSDMSSNDCHIASTPVFFSFFFFLHLTYSRWTSSLPSCLWSQRIFPSLPGSRLTIFYRDASSALLLQLVNQWLNFTYSRSHAFRYERKNTNPTLVRIELTTSAYNRHAGTPNKA